MSSVAPLNRLEASWVDFHLQSLRRSLDHWKKSGKVPQTLLLSGIEGCGITEMSYWLAQWMLCDQFSDLDSPILPCGTCAPCTRALENQWLDLVEISPALDEDGEESGSLKVDQFRQLKETQGFGAYASRYRIILIRRADRMTPQAANSILKIIEEPPPGWIFLLTAPDPQSVITTILSRCQRLSLSPLPDLLLEEHARSLGLSPTQSKRVVPLAQGSVDRLRDFGQSEVLEKLDLIEQCWERPQSISLPLIEWGSQSPKNLALLLDALEQQCLIGMNSENRHARAEKLSRKLARARSLQNTPVNKKILIQELLFGIF